MRSDNVAGVDWFGGKSLFVTVCGVVGSFCEGVVAGLVAGGGELESRSFWVFWSSLRVRWRVRWASLR